MIRRLRLGFLKLRDFITFLLVATLLVLPVAAVGCGMTGRQIQAHSASAVAQGANAALPILVERYRQQGLRAIDKAETREAAEAALVVIKAEWKPVWDAWEVLRVAQDAWAQALEGGGDTISALWALRVAFCGLQRVWPNDIPAIPIASLSCPKKETK